MLLFGVVGASVLNMFSQNEIAGWIAELFIACARGPFFVPLLVRYCCRPFLSQKVVSLEKELVSERERTARLASELRHASTNSVADVKAALEQEKVCLSEQSLKLLLNSSFYCRLTEVGRQRFGIPSLFLGTRFPHVLMLPSNAFCCVFCHFSA